MRSRRWSSLGIWGCSGVGAALLLAAPAGAGVDVSPQRIDPGQTARLVFWVPNQGKSAITSVAIGMPSDFRLGEAESKYGWRTSLRARTASWTGSRIAPGQFAFFSVTVKAPQVEERAVFSILASNADGRTATYQAQVNVVPAEPMRDQTARLIATIALIVASVGGLVALAGGLLALWLWLRPRPPDAF
jgi:uncharacterized protein YcnI